jgi:hypothetical protein
MASRLPARDTGLLPDRGGERRHLDRESAIAVPLASHFSC